MTPQQRIDDATQKLGITLNEMQQHAHKAILAGNSDVLVLSPTGSGKTLAYLLPLLAQVNTTVEALQVVVVVPGRELAQQGLRVMTDVKSAAKGFACYGGRSAMEEHRLLRKTLPHVVFGTPGRLVDHLKKENLSAKAVTVLVIDEFDKCLEMGFQQEMTELLSLLPHLKRHILLSATDAPEAAAFVNSKHLERLDFLESRPASERIAIYKAVSDDKDKLPSLVNMLLQMDGQSTIVFLNHRDAVERVAAGLRERGFIVSAYHGGLEQKDRERELYLFANGSTNVLVSTDLGSRGLDLPYVDNIIHYHLPDTAHTYTHRIGRTARWDKQGNAFFLLNSEEHVPDYVDGEVASHTIAQPDADHAQAPLPAMTTIYIGKGKKDKVSKGDVVGFLCKTGGLTGNDIGRIDVTDRYALVAIARAKAKLTLKQLAGAKIKGNSTVVEVVR